MDATIIIAIVPVVLLVAYIVWLVRAKITEGRDIDLREPITGVVICLVAVLIIGSMTASTVTYTYSEDTNTLYINQNLIDSRQPFDSYGDEVKSVVIGNNCRLVETGTLDSLTSLEYVKIGSDVDVRPGAFGISFKDSTGAAVEVSEGEYVGPGNGSVYMADESVFTYTQGNNINGLASQSSVYLVIPRTHNGAAISSISDSSFASNTAIRFVGALPDSTMQTIGTNSFKGCSSLTDAVLPDSVTACGANVFQECVALDRIDMPETLTRVGGNFLRACTSLESVEIPRGLTTLTQGMFHSCSALTTVSMPGVTDIESAVFYECAALETADMPSVRAIGTSAFQSCTSMESFSFTASVTTISGSAFRLATGVTQVSFASGFSAELADAWAYSWTFYASDGTTVIDKTDAANLAGKTFQGTAAALVEVAPGMLSLTPQQLQQVQLHTQELQQQELDIQPLPFQPTVQTQDQEPVAA